jgi:NAD-dependent dihydropyrimidine dehydrogenase PreA subunit
MVNESDVYRKLQQHLHKMPVGFPPTKTGVEIDLLKSIFTPEQATIATHLDYKHKTIDQIYESANEEIDSKDELKLILDETVSNGGISRRRRDGGEQYAVLPFLMWGMYEHQLKRLNQDFLDNSGEYIMGEFGLEFATSRLPKMRVIPVEESIKIEHHIATYDELRRLIEQAGNHIAVQECFCRKASDMQGKPCQATDRRELCMSFGDLADLYVDEGWARQVDQQEALEMARQNEEAGLVLMPGNQQEPNFMCSCCSDCCQVLNMIQNFPRPADGVASNHYVAVNTELCTGVGDCVGRCPMQAVSLNNGYAVVDLTRCIGCGLCVPVCPEHALSLIAKEQETIPPVTTEDLFDTELAKKSTLAGKVRNYSLKTFIRVASRFSN